MLKSYLSKREALLQLGAQENDLPLSAELAKAKEVPDVTKFAPIENEADVTDDSDRHEDAEDTE